MPGMPRTAQTLFDVDDDPLRAAFLSDFTLDGSDINQFRALIPKNMALGFDSCLQSCGTEKGRGEQIDESCCFGRFHSRCVSARFRLIYRTDADRVLAGVQ